MALQQAKDDKKRARQQVATDKLAEKVAKRDLSQQVKAAKLKAKDEAAKALARAATKELKVCIRLCWGDGAQMLYAVVPSSE